MLIQGGVTQNDAEVSLTFSIGGGRSCKKVYNDSARVAISRFALIGSSISKSLRSDPSTAGARFYMDQIVRLLSYAHVDFLVGDAPFQRKYNMWLADGYLSMLLESRDTKMITQLLNLDAILYAVEEGGRFQDVQTNIEYEVPTKLASPMGPESSVPDSDDDKIQFLRAMDVKLQKLVEIITANEKLIVQAYENILKTAKKQLHE